MHGFAVGALERLEVGVAAEVGDVEKVVEVIGVDGPVVGVGGFVDEGYGVLDAKGVDVVGEGLSVDAVDGVDDLVLRDVEGVGKGEDGEVGVEEGLILYVLRELASEGGEVAGA